MKSFTKLALAAAVLAVPFMAQADLKSMDDATLSNVTGQAGISISGTFSATVGKVALTQNGNALIQEDISLPSLTISDANPLKIDIITDTFDSKQKLQITLPAITGDIAIGSINLGTYSNGTLTSGKGTNDLGGQVISGLNLAGSTIKVWGH